MHLSLVPKRTYSFDHADMDLPIPAHVLARSLEDAPRQDTPFGLEDFRYFLSDWETGCVNTYPDDFWCVAFVDFAGDRKAGIVPLVTEHYARTKVLEVFAQWQATRPGRDAIIISVTRGSIMGPDHPENGDGGLVVRLVDTRSAQS